MLLCIPFFPTCLLLLFLGWIYFPIPFLLFLNLILSFIFDCSFPLRFLHYYCCLILYLILLLLSSLSHRRCFGGFALFILALFVWSIYPCCLLWYCDISSMSYNLVFALLSRFQSQLLVQHKALYVKIFLLVCSVFILQ